MDKDSGFDSRDNDRASSSETSEADLTSPTGKAPAAGSPGSRSFGIDVPTNGISELMVRFANGWAEPRQVTLHVDSESTPNTLSFPSTGGWSLFETLTIPVKLETGHRQLTFADLNGSGPEISEVSLNEAVPGAGLSSTGEREASAMGLASIAALALTSRIEDSEAREPRAEDDAKPSEVPPQEEREGQEESESSVPSNQADKIAQPQEQEPTSLQSIQEEPQEQEATMTAQGSGTSQTGSEPVGAQSATSPGLTSQASAQSFSLPQDSSGSGGAPSMAAMAAPLEEELTQEGQILIQAEAAELTPEDGSTTIRNPRNTEDNPDLDPSGLRPDFSGSGYLDFGDTAGDTATYPFFVAEAGSYTFHIRYATSTNRPLDFTLDGGSPTSLPFVTTDPDGTGPEDGFDNWEVQTVTLALSEGAHTFSLAIPQGANSGPNIDAIAITAEGGTPDFSAGNSLPVVAETAFQVMEGELEVGTLSASDQDGDLVEFFLTENATTDNALFTIDSDTGALSFIQAPDFENPQAAGGSNDYTLEIEVQDGTGSTTETITVTVTDDPDESEEPDPGSISAFTIQAEDDTQVTVDDSGTVDTDASWTREVNPDRDDAFGNYRAGAVDDAYIDFGTNPGDAIVFNVDAPAAGSYSVTFRYANGAAEDRPLDLILNDGEAVSVSFEPGPIVGTGPDATAWASWVEQTVELSLVDGMNTIRLEIPDGAVNGPNIDQATFAYLDGEDPVSFSSVILQAEEAEVVDTSNPEVDTSNPEGALTNSDTQVRNPDNPESPDGKELDANGLRPGYSGDGYVDFGLGAGSAGDGATFEIEAPAAGSYTLHVRYANGGTTPRPLAVTVDDASAGTMNFAGAPAGTEDAWSHWMVETLTVPLSEGPNSLKLAIDASSLNGPNIDAIAITEVGGEPSMVPVITSSQTASVVEGETAVSEISATDEDGDALVYSLTTTGADNDLFTIDPATGALSFIEAPAFDAEGDNDYEVEVAVMDGWFRVKQTVTVSVSEAPSNTAPEITSAPGFMVDENSSIVGAVVADDIDGDTLDYSLSGADADKLAIDAEGNLTLVAAANFENPDDADADGVLAATVTVSDGTTSSEQEITVTVGDVNEAPSAISLGGAGALAENAASGTIIGALSAFDPDAGDVLTFTVDDSRFLINSSNQLVVADGASFDAAGEPEITVTVTASDSAGLESQQQIPLAVEGPAEPVETTTMLFDAETLTSYSLQDAGTGASVADEGATLTLAGNLWKRAPLPDDYTIMQGTKLVVDVTLGSVLSEIVAIGLDDDDSPFEMGDRSVYQLAGSEPQGAFVDLRNGDPGTPGETFTVTIDLSAHAGQTIDSLVFIADDDFSGNGIGSASFSNVRLLNEASDPEENAAPTVIGGGITDLVLPERSNLEIDMPFVDPEGDEITYSIAATDPDGNPVSGLEDLVFQQGTLSGPLGLAPSLAPYTVTITADDGNGGITTTDFQLTVENVNDAPVLNDGVALEPYFAAVGQEIPGIDLALFADAFTDPDGDTLVLTAEGLPAGLSVNSEGVIVGTPTEAGEGTITIVATDPEGLRAELELGVFIDGPQVGDVTVVEGEAFTGLDEAESFYVAATPGASENQIIRTNANQTGSVSTVLGDNGLAEGWYDVSITVYDENDGTASFSLMIGDTVLAEGLTFDEAGDFDNPSQPRGNAGQAGNLKTIAFTAPVFVDEATVATLTGQADSGEYLRIDKLTFTRIESPVLPPENLVLDTPTVAENAEAAVIGLLSAEDPDGDAASLVYTTEDSRFVIDGDQLRLADGVSLDHEAGESVTVTVTATDTDGLSTTTDLTIAVEDVNETPVLSASADIEDLELEEGTAGSVDLAAALGASDQDEGTTLAYLAQLDGGDPLPAGMTVVDGILQIDDSVAVGDYVVEAFASDGELDSDSVSFTVSVSEPGAEPPFEPIVIQAETGAIESDDPGDNDTVTTVRDPDNQEPNEDLPNGLRPDFTGTGYIDFGDTPGDTVSYTVTVPSAGTYEFAIRYATNTDRPLDFAVNDSTALSLPFASTDPDGNGPDEGFDNWLMETVTVELEEGENTFSLAIPAGATTGPNIDSITITQPDTEDTSADADDIPLFLTGPQGELNETEAASINFNIAGVDSDIVGFEISFDGGATRTEIFPDADGDFTADGSALDAGTYSAIVYVTDEVGNEASASMEFIVAGEGVSVDPFTIQAEDDTQVTVDDSGTVDTDASWTREVNLDREDAFGNYRAGAVDDAYIDFGTNPGDAIVFNVDAPAAGSYSVTFRYANGDTVDRPLDLVLNDGEAVSVSFEPGPIVGTGPDATAWASWVEQTVELSLVEGANTIRLEIPDGAVNGPNIDQATFAYLDGPVDPVDSFEVTIEGESFTPDDDTGTGAAQTQARTPENPETNTIDPDVDGDNLWDGSTGPGYLDMGSQIGDAAEFNVDVPDAGTYTFEFRYSNGGGGDNGDRPMTLSVDGEAVTVSFPGTGVNGWDNWATATVEVELAAGTNTVRLENTVDNGPNIDNVTVSREGSGPVDPRDQVYFEEVVKINFEPVSAQTTQGLPAGYATPEGYLADTGQAFGERGNGFSYGWVTEASVADGTENGTLPSDQPANAHWYKDSVSEASDLQKTYAHFEYPGASGTPARAWEMELENGTYQVTLSVGDTAGAFDSNYNINVEGQSFMPDWVPANPINGSTNGGGFRSTLVTGMVTVTDGRLTIDSIGGDNTEIQYLAVEQVPDLTPGDDRTADLDYSFFTAPVAASLEDGQVSIAIGPDGELPTDIDPTSSFVIGVNLQAEGNRGPNVSYVDNIKLVETLTGEDVAINVQVSGGADSLTIRPLQDLKENTSYTLKVQDVLDLGSVTDPDGALRQFQDLTTSFVTGETPEDVAREVAFTTDVLLDGFTDGAGGYTSVEFGPDGKLYVATITGEIHRWDVNTDGTVDKESQETLSLDHLETPGDRRGIIGFVFDPEDPNTIWITDNAPVPRQSKAFDTPEFSGRVSKVTLGEDGSFEDATAEAYITGLPRSGGDHLTNSLEFRANPDAGQPGEPDYLLYLTQGSNSAAGAPDNAWGNRPERLLNAAVLEIDPRQEAPEGGFDVRTEPIDLDDDPTTSFPESAFNEDGTYPEMYNPYAEDAVLKIFATGVRNAYDLVWHSNGHLYIPTNGTASGGKTPQDPSQPGFDTTINNSPKQYDYFFTVDEGGYYGHPVALRDEYILNGGNPTSGSDPNEVVGGNDGNSSTDGYQSGVQVDENYDYDGVYNLGYNQSPNGATEYVGNAFGSNLKGAILFAQFSTGDNVRALRVDANGNIIDDDVLRRPDGSVIDDYIDPLDIIENPITGQLYLMTLNRGSGASQLVLLTPAPGGVTQDLTADEGGDLVLVPVDVSEPSAALFQVNGLDDDITALRISFNDGPKTTIELDGQNRFTFDLGVLEGPVTATLEVTDDVLNTATVNTEFTPGEEPSQDNFVTLVTIQAEDDTPADGTSVTVAMGAEAEIEIRDADNLETGTGEGYVNGLRPGAYGLDGNTDNLDGTPGGYADFGFTNADFMTFTFDVPQESAGNAILRFRYSNGGDEDRPLQLEINGTIVNVQPFAPTGSGTIDGWTQWATVEVPVTLLDGENSVTLRAVDDTGPNIDQLEVLIPEGGTGPISNDGEVVIDGVTYLLYEAENADLGGPVIVTEDRDQSGDGFVDFDGSGDQTITWTVSATQAGTYSLDFLYALGASKAARPMGLSVNGEDMETLAFLPNSNEGETLWGPQNATIDLIAGDNTITLTAPEANGPNVDLLRITKEPISVFEPDYADISGSGRIELEADDGSANTVNGSVVDFYFTVDADGIYKLDTAANSGATNGQGLSWFLNGVEFDESDFPGAGETGEESAYIQLTAGEEYQLRIVSDAPGANGLDYLDIQPAPGNANADIEVQSLDPAYLDNRLHFSYLENPNGSAPDRDFKDSGTVRISNSGSETLDILEAELSGPFVLADPSIFEGLTLDAGASLDVEILFDRSAYTPPTSNVDGTSTVFTGELELRTNDADSPIATVDLAGFWQARDEGGQEPNVNEIWQIFGFGNRIEGLTLNGGGENSALSTNDVFAKTDETEVLSPYWRIADGYAEAKITQIAAFHGAGGADIGIHNPGNKGAQVNFWNHEGTDNQRLLPNSGNDSTFSTETFTANDIPDGWIGNDVFGIRVANLSTDPTLNPTGDVIVPDEQQGHTVKVFQALDADGNVIPNVFLGIMDYTGINYDYNDNLFVIEGVSPVGFGQEMVVAGLDDAAADDRLVFTSIDNPANGQQNVRDEATFTISNDGFAPLEIEDIVISDPTAFEFVGTLPTSIPAGGSAEATVRFIGEHSGTDAGADLINATLTITSNDLTAGDTVVQLAGLAQEFSENNSEPTVAQIVEAFGYGTDMAQGELAGGGAVETVGDEVLMPYLQKLDSSQPVEVIQLAAFLQQNNVARLGVHGLEAGEVTNLFAQDDQEYQTVLPNSHVAGDGAGSSVARGQINQNGPFGLFISVDGRPTYASWSDPEANRIDPDFGQLVGDDQGHLIRFFQALDADGNVIEGTYIAIQDYPGAGNYDYNDHMFVIKNVQPYQLTDADDSNGDMINDALQNDTDDDGTVDFFDPDTDPVDPVDPEEPGDGSRGDFVLGINFGGDAIANDPVLGVPLVGQGDSRVSLSGSINPGAGVDAPTNPNGAGATPGSAFTTYEDGADWTAAIDVPNGTYVVVLHTQETYWNSAGQRQFDISVNGEQVVSDLDPFATAGGDEPIAIETVVTVTNGEIVIDLSADIDNAPLNAVTIYEYVEPGSGQTPFSGTPVLVDADGAVIIANEYDEGGQDIAYNDAEGLQGGTTGGRDGSDVEVTSSGDIGWIESGEWLEYTVDLASAGEYDLGLLLSNGGGDGRSATVNFYRPGETTPYASSGPVANPQTASWTSFVNRPVEGVDLEAGEQIVRVTFEGGSQDFRSFSLTPVEQEPGQSPYGGTAPSFTDGTLTVDATNFDEGGQDIAYNDDPGLDNPTSNPGFRPERDVEFVGAELDIGHVEPGEWVEYTIDVPAAGDYSFSVDAKTPVSGASVAVSLGAGAALGVVSLADGHAGGSDFSSADFAQSEAITIPLEAGLQTLRLTFDGPLASNGYVLDLRSFTLEAEQDAQAMFSTMALSDEVDPQSGGEDVATAQSFAAMSEEASEPLFDQPQTVELPEETPPFDSGGEMAEGDLHQDKDMAHIFGYDLLT
ncbi:MAG: carbohydrate-binding protein [Pseudomonadota bacterium]